MAQKDRFTTLTRCVDTTRNVEIGKENTINTNEKDNIEIRITKEKDTCQDTYGL